MAWQPAYVPDETGEQSLAARRREVIAAKDDQIESLAGSAPAERLTSILVSGGLPGVAGPRLAIEFIGELLPHPRVVASQLPDDPDAMRGHDPGHIAQLGLAQSIDVQETEHVLPPLIVAQ